MKTPHKHAAIIKAWADGETIQYKMPGMEGWVTCHAHPCWDETTSYRVKPELKPDTVSYYSLGFLKRYARETSSNNNDDAIAIMFDGETGNVKSVQVLK